MKKISITLITFMLLSNLPSIASAPAPAQQPAFVLKKVLPPTVAELDALMRKKEKQEDMSVLGIFKTIRKNYSRYNCNLAECALATCSINQIKALGIPPLTKCALSQKFFENKTTNPSTGTDPIHIALDKDPDFDYTYPTLDGKIPLLHYPFDDLEGNHNKQYEISQKLEKILDAQGNTYLHIAIQNNRSPDYAIFRCRFSDSNTKKIIINHKNDLGQVALLMVAQEYRPKEGNKAALCDGIILKLFGITPNHMIYNRVKELLKHGADPEIVDNDGTSFAQLAARCAALAQAWEEAQEEIKAKQAK